MSEINVYTNSLSDDLIPQLIKRFKDYEMEVEISPYFSFVNVDEDNCPYYDSLVFKFVMKNPAHQLVKDKILRLKLGFSINDFDLEDAKSDIEQPEQSFIDKLLRRKKEIIEFAPPKFESQLKRFKKVSSFYVSSGITYDYRFAYLISTILAELTYGIYSITDEEYSITDKDLKSVTTWEKGSSELTDKTYKQIIAHEKGIPDDDFDFQEFKGW